MLSRKRKAELLPCPFCGGSPGMMLNAAEGWHVRYVKCACGAQAREFVYTQPELAEAQAIEAWNTRAMPEEGCGEADGWRDIASAPVGMHFLAAYFYAEGGEWVYDVAMLHRDHACGVNEGAGPFTHWRPLPAPPVAASPTGVGEEA